MDGKWAAILILLVALVGVAGRGWREAAFALQWERILDAAAHGRARELCRAVEPPFAPKGIVCVRYWTGPKP